MRFGLALLCAAAIGLAGCGGASGGDVKAARASAEAGHLEVPASGAGPRGRARLFYAFHPVADASAKAPVVVLFNGGPGGATSAGLLAFGTGPFTLTAAPGAPPAPAPNPASWTRFANVLYLDERVAGYSYGLDALGCQGKPSDAELYVADAADFIHALLDFLDAHAELTGAPVVIAAESYGATRATLMLYLLQHYVERGPLDSELPDVDAIAPWLRARVQAHFDAVSPSRAGEPASPARVAAQFGRMVWLEGFIAGAAQLQASEPVVLADPILARCTTATADCDEFDVRRTNEDYAAIDAMVGRALRDPAAIEQLVGVAPDAIGGLAATERLGALRVADARNGTDADVAAAEHELRGALGELPSGDAYWLEWGLSCRMYLGDLVSLRAMFDVLERTDAFMTRARYDLAIHPEGMVPLVAEVGFHGAIREDAPVGAARKGVLELSRVGGPTRSVRFPRYEAGHSIAQTAGGELADDVEAWLRGDGAVP